MEPGIRISELINLKAKNVNITKKEIKVLGKRNKERIVPIHDHILIQIDRFTNKKNDIISRSGISSMYTKRRPTIPNADL